jgi:hypothetical protein
MRTLRPLEVDDRNVRSGVGRKLMTNWGLRWFAGTSGVCLFAVVLAQPARSGKPNDGCELMPQQQVEAVVNGAVDMVIPSRGDADFGCFYTGGVVAGLDLRVKVWVGHTKEIYERQLRWSPPGPNLRISPIDGFGDKAAWIVEPILEKVHRRLIVLSEPYVVMVSDMGAVSSEADDLARARALAQRAIANAKDAGL